MIASCKKDRISLDWEYVSISSNQDLSKIRFDTDGRGYVVGGKEWESGVLGTSMDGGYSWEIDSFTNKRLYDVYIDEAKNVYTVGVDGYLFSKTPQSSWVFHRLPKWFTHKGVAFQSNGFGLIGTGGAFGNGIISTYTDQEKLQQEFELDFEISDVAFSDAKSLHAVGYGVILKSQDQGASWDWADIDGDFFQAIQFVDENTGYVIGITGSILKTTDAGNSWEYLRNSGRLAKDYPFRDLYFLDKSHGFICGEDGLLWYTKDAGDSWQQVEGLPEEQFLSVSAYGDYGFLVGEAGVFIRFLLP